jgi:hypothetical protein
MKMMELIIGGKNLVIENNEQLVQVLKNMLYVLGLSQTEKQAIQMAIDIIEKDKQN